MNPIPIDRLGVLQIGAGQHWTLANEGWHFIDANDEFSIPRGHSSADMCTVLQTAVQWSLLAIVLLLQVANPTPT